MHHPDEEAGDNPSFLKKNNMRDARGNILEEVGEDWWEGGSK